MVEFAHVEVAIKESHEQGEEGEADHTHCDADVLKLDVHVYSRIGVEQGVEWEENDRVHEGFEEELEQAVEPLLEFDESGVNVALHHKNQVEEFDEYEEPDGDQAEEKGEVDDSDDVGVSSEPAEVSEGALEVEGRDHLVEWALDQFEVGDFEVEQELGCHVLSVV